MHFIVLKQPKQEVVGLKKMRNYTSQSTNQASKQASSNRNLIAEQSVSQNKKHIVFL